MRPRRLVLTAVAVAALAVTASACGPENSDPATSASGPATTAAAPATTAPAAPAAPTSAPAGAPTSAPAAAPTTAKPSASTPAQAAGTCATKDVVLTAKAESQAGGYILITVKAKPGVTCTLAARRPVIAFGSGGIEAAKAEQTPAQPIKLSGSEAAYAGVMTKTTKDNQAIQFGDVIVGVNDPDPDPVSLPIGPTNVDKPIVTNWHTRPAEAVPIH
ncbi:hypothetical protein [Kitasatospora purpeofusca]|uniref:hypothetical protein n=1 Tax=Kitasatospora purpeofusca TaxID=67352 RepID=UPI002252B28B|nr:hypothetical protein [Kitasatospora purpeofusca]MCX4757394.1 DUF4232 domain-containing protein [Kitasatospora purpeofusca]WSR34868.1 DUF4232 domain-containing protein [Kitasatospora purpeofusca]WSR43086.1 DUF4232 domain-containing protein [Kitasatospora purpeofusca]